VRGLDGVERLVARADTTRGFDYRHRVRAGSANLALCIPIAARLRNAQERAGSSKLSNDMRNVPTLIGGWIYSRQYPEKYRE